MKNPLITSIFAQLLFLSLISCQTTPYLPAQQKVMVDHAEVTVSQYHGRPDISLIIKGRLSSNAAHLVDVKQSRGKGNLLIVEVNEQTVRGGTPTNRVPNPPFQKRIPLEVIGLLPGMAYIVDVNGTRTQFVMPREESEQRYASSTTGFEYSSY